MKTQDLAHSLLESWHGRAQEMALATIDASFTFHDLEMRAGAWSALFREKGLAPGDRLGIVLEKGLDALACIFAALAERITYVPLDPGAPPDRIAYILELAKPQAVVMEPESTSRGPVPSISRTELGTPQSLRIRPGDPSDVAYIIFTSGSEGQPKGVMIDHAALMNFAAWVRSYFASCAGQRIMNIASLSFDQSVLDYVMMAVLGCPMVILAHARNPLALLATIEQQQVSIISTVPNTFSFLLEGEAVAGRFDLSCLRTLILGGSPFHGSLRDCLARLCPQVKLYNLYGPTEATVYCSARVVGLEEPFEFDPLPLGRPILNTRMALIEDDGSEISGPGQGELVISGLQVMVGYWRDQKRTEAVLSLDPEGHRQYRTGDLVRRTDQGEYYFVGRRDDQVKVAGYRVSLLEVENALISHPDVSEAAVVACRDQRIENRLVAFVAGGEPETLLAYLTAKLPGYMIPQSLFMRSELPKNTSGKIDKVSLRKEAQVSIS